ncbi:MAG: tetratricopeptide repeat protein [Candidatus Tectomicrobia bacterium]|uniref:Tetratricopeptide repeat protein n=1 Tax=Tectimicrobiota bacterium TaxID=2528274 RepID=A0A932G0Z6_UNCTE|nr:tetratricopeptide repeat protein [Candidatus Tectomicrobia bacterium]
MPSHRSLRWVVLALLSALGLGCAALGPAHEIWNKTTDWLTGQTTIHLEILEPAHIMVPPDIQTLAVLDRSQATNMHEGAVGVIEAALTGEEIGADYKGRAEAMRGLMNTLGASPRFRVIQPILSQQEAESGIFDRELSWEAAHRICQRSGCEGIIALEAFDSNSTLTRQEKAEEILNEKGDKVQRWTYQLQRKTRVVVAWRLYDTQRMVVLDRLHDSARSRTWDAKGESHQEAVSRLPSQYETVHRLGIELGQEYARRVAPSYVTVPRKFYSSGDPRFKEAKAHVEVNHWPGAVRLWETVARESNPKLRDRAFFNLALARELEGDLTGALDLARKAALGLRNWPSREYVRLVEQRIEDQARLDRQMAPPPAPPNPSPRSRR